MKNLHDIPKERLNTQIPDLSKFARALSISFEEATRRFNNALESLRQASEELTRHP